MKLTAAFHYADLCCFACGKPINDVYLRTWTDTTLPKPLEMTTLNLQELKEFAVEMDKIPQGHETMLALYRFMYYSLNYRV